MIFPLIGHPQEEGFLREKIRKIDLRRRKEIAIIIDMTGDRPLVMGIVNTERLRVMGGEIIIDIVEEGGRCGGRIKGIALSHY